MSEAQADAAEVPAAAKGREKARNVAFEAALGARIRTARIAAGLSQSALGGAVNVSFQQIQKYELGRDRVSASRLAAIAAVLHVHPGSFYGSDMLAPSGDVPEVRAVWQLAERLQRMRNPAIIKRIMALFDELSGSGSIGPKAG